MDCWKDQKGSVNRRRGNLFLCFLDAGTASKKHTFWKMPEEVPQTGEEGLSLYVFGARSARPKNILFTKVPEGVPQAGEEGFLFVFLTRYPRQKYFLERHRKRFCKRAKRVFICMFFGRALRAKKHTFWKMPEEIP